MHRRRLLTKHTNRKNVSGWYVWLFLKKNSIEGKGYTIDYDGNDAPYRLLLTVAGWMWDWLETVCPSTETRGSKILFQSQLINNNHLDDFNVSTHGEEVVSEEGSWEYVLRAAHSSPPSSPGSTYPKSDDLLPVNQNRESHPRYITWADRVRIPLAAQ